MPKRTQKFPPSGKRLPRQPRNVRTPSTGDATKKSKASKTENKEKEDKNKATTSSGESKMTLSSLQPTPVRPQPRERRLGRLQSGKRLSTLARDMPGKVRSSYRRSLDPCDNSNDSGLGFDHHPDPNHAHALTMGERLTWTGEQAEPKRPRLDIKLEHDEVNDGYSFPDSVYTCKQSQGLIRTAPTCSVPPLSLTSNPSSSSGRAVPRCIPLANRQSSSSSIPLTAQLSSSSQYADVMLQIVKQPEQQHRARYQTEGSRGAVKDREGNGFPIVQLSGYYKPTALQVFIGTDVGKVQPHMFYQACKVSGKNSTPCIETKVEGTCVIELQLDPAKDMSATCDCVGILKERNVDVELRYPNQPAGRPGKKKSTKCRMIFRTTITLDDGTQETLQVCSQPIVCTQPPGIPEIGKKSLTHCPASGGLELFIIGKNFLKDTRVLFQQYDDDRHCKWEQYVVPDKEYLQQTHLVCVVPPYCRSDITEPVVVRLCVVSSGKTSEPHQFVYTPVNGVMASVCVCQQQQQQRQPQGQFFNWPSSVSKREQDLGMMPPPETNMVPLSTRRSSISVPSSSDIIHSPPLHSLKQEYIDENSESSIIDPVELSQGRFRHISESSLDVHHGDSNMSMINDNSIDMIRRNSINNEITNHSINENSNMSMSDEKSLEILTRRNSVNRPMTSICENANMTLINEDSTCTTSVRCNNPITADRIVSQKILPASKLVTNTPEDLKVIDLRMKMPLGTVADLVNTCAPSMATLQRLGVTEASMDPLPAQSAQSIETFLISMEAKTLASTNGLSTNNVDLKPNLNQIINPDVNNTFIARKMMNRQAMQAQACNNLLTTTTKSLNSNISMVSAVSNSEPVFLSSQRPYLSTATETETMRMIAKSEGATIADKVVPEPTNTMAPSNLNGLAPTVETRVSTPINSEKLDALVNSTVEAHIGSPEMSECKNATMASKVSSQRVTPTQSDILMSPQDVILNQQSNLLMPPMINTRLASPTLQQELSQQVSPTISPEVILNSQISPSLMCRNTASLTQESLLPSAGLNAISQQPTTLEQGLLPIAVNVTQKQQVPLMMSTNTSQRSPNITNVRSPNNLQLSNEPEKAVIYQATADFLATQEHIGHLVEKNGCMDNIMTITTNSSDVIPNPRPLVQLSVKNGNNFVQSPFNLSPTIAQAETTKMENKDTMININNIIMTTNSSSVLPNSQSLGQLSVTNGNNLVQSSFNISPTTVQPETSKSDFVIPVPVKEIAQSVKKDEDRMIPEVFTSLTTNQLLDFIDPNSFNQV